MLDVAVLEVERDEEEVDVTTTVEEVELNEELLLERVVESVVEARLDVPEVAAVLTGVVLAEDDGSMLDVCASVDDEDSCVDDCGVVDEDDETPPQDELPPDPDEIKE
ncbi:MAG: hypothetical protein Q9195_007646 [Heterodermia aff. obscurata]